jgi:hypothetical protein
VSLFVVIVIVIVIAATTPGITKLALPFLRNTLTLKPQFNALT